jgi:recombinational DNA repair protein (RecF pathway)
METKSCAKCWETKPVEEFYVYNNSYCKKCVRKLTSDWQKRNPIKNREKQKRWRRNNPEKAREKDRINNERKKNRRTP